MKRTDETQGRRLPDVRLADHHEATGVMGPGDYVRILDYPGPFPASNLTGEVWFVTTPNGPTSQRTRCARRTTARSA